MSRRDAWGRYTRPSLPTCYVVDWPEVGVFKVGYSEHKRWTRFVFSGADVVVLHRFPGNVRSAFAMEEYLHGYARELYPQAWDTKGDEAVRLLGSGAGGWLECYRGSGHDFHHLMLKHCSLSIAQITGRASVPSIATDVRNGRTNADASSPAADTSPSVPRTRTYGDPIIPTRGGTP